MDAHVLAQLLETHLGPPENKGKQFLRSHLKYLYSNSTEAYRLLYISHDRGRENSLCNQSTFEHSRKCYQITQKEGYKRIRLNDESVK
jgi:hypothetical protein